MKYIFTWMSQFIYLNSCFQAYWRATHPPAVLTSTIGGVPRPIPANPSPQPSPTTPTTPNTPNNPHDRNNQTPGKFSLH